MTITDLLKTMPSSKFFTYMMISIAVIIPGFGYIYLSRFELFLSLEIVKLILLSIFYSTPLLMLGILYTILENKVIDKAKEDYYRKLMNQVSSFIIVSYFLSIIGFFLLKRPIGLDNMMNYSYVVAIFLVILAICKKVIIKLCNFLKSK